MKVAFTNLEATLLLLTQHELNYKMQDPDGVELFNFQVALADLVEGAKHAVDCYDRVDTPSWEIADLRTSAA